MSVTGYPFDGYDGSDESFGKLVDEQSAKVNRSCVLCSGGIGKFCACLRKCASPRCHAAGQENPLARAHRHDDGELCAIDHGKTPDRPEGGHVDLTVEWDVVAHRSAVTSVPDDATHESKLEAASALAASLTGIGGEGSVVRGTVRYQASDGTFGGRIA